MTTEKQVLDLIDTELKSMERSIVATPDTRAQLESFANANQGSMDMVLMQQSIQFGYAMALENIKDQISKQVITQ
jgi:hypothetical protein